VERQTSKKKNGEEKRKISRKSQLIQMTKGEMTKSGNKDAS